MKYLLTIISVLSITFALPNQSQASECMAKLKEAGVAASKDGRCKDSIKVLRKKVTSGKGDCKAFRAKVKACRAAEKKSKKDCKKAKNNKQKRACKKDAKKRFKACKKAAKKSKAFKGCKKQVKTVLGEVGKVVTQCGKHLVKAAPVCIKELGQLLSQ